MIALVFVNVCRIYWVSEKLFTQQRCDNAVGGDVDGWLLVEQKKNSANFLCVVCLVCVHYVSRPKYNWSVVWLHGATKVGFSPSFFLTAWSVCCVVLCCVCLRLVFGSFFASRSLTTTTTMVRAESVSTGAWWWKSLNIDVNNRRTNERTNERIFFFAYASAQQLFLYAFEAILWTPNSTLIFFLSPIIDHFGLLLNTLCYHHDVCVAWFKHRLKCHRGILSLFSPSPKHTIGLLFIVNQNAK